MPANPDAFLDEPAGLPPSAATVPGVEPTNARERQSPESIADRRIHAGSPVADPDVYWARLWSTALPMSALVAVAEWRPEATVLELGCGIGIVGMTALARGWSVTFNDHVPLAVQLALRNAAANGLPGGRGLAFDWRSPPRESFDIVLGSDILYDLSLHSTLLNLLSRMLRAGGQAWFADPGRHQTASWIELAWDRGFDVELLGSNGEVLRAPTRGEFQLLQLQRYDGPVCEPHHD